MKLSAIINGPSNMSDVSDTMTGSWRRLLAQNSSGHRGFIQNIGSNNMGVYLAPIDNDNTPPVPAGIGNEGVLTLVPGGTIDLSEGGAPINEIWVIGTNTDVVTAFVAV